MENWTKGKWEAKQRTGDSYRIFSDVPETKRAIAHSKWIGNIWDEANARRIVKCCNGYDGLVAENTVLKETVHTLRPLAECYQRVCETLGIEKDILGHVSKLKSPNDSLVKACKRIMRRAKTGKSITVGDVEVLEQALSQAKE